MKQEAQEDELQETRVIESWAKIYDLVNFFFSLLFKGTKRLHTDIIALSRIANGDRVLDIGCGTGEFLIDLTDRLNTIEACGIDASKEMVAIAKTKAVKKGYDRLSFEFSRAEELPYTPETFDCVFNTFLLHHLPMQSKLLCLSEAYRVLRPDKPLILVDVDKPSNLLGRFIGMTRSNVREIHESMQQPLTELLRKAGFSSIQLVRQDYGIFSFIRCKK